MKKFTSIAFLFVAAIVGLSSCNSNSEVSPTDDLSAYTDFMFLASSGDSTSADSSHHHHGSCNVTEIVITDLPATITDYITANYAGSTIDRAGTLTDGSYVVKITKADGTNAGLKFDSTGTFVEERTGKAPHTHIAVSELPTVITDYITANYAGSTIEKAAVNTDGTYVALVKKADGTMVGTAFDANGVFTGEVAVAPHPEGGKGGKGGKRGKGH